MTANDTDDGHWTVGGDAIAAKPVSSPTAISNASTVCVMQIGRSMVSCSTQCRHVDLVLALHVIPENIKNKQTLVPFFVDNKHRFYSRERNQSEYQAQEFALDLNKQKRVDLLCKLVCGKSPQGFLESIGWFTWFLWVFVGLQPG